MSLAYKAMLYAREVHAKQVRKYTGNPYTDHLAEVVGIAMSVGWHHPQVHPDVFMAVAWLHDSVEDQGVGRAELTMRFGADVAAGVLWLSDTETGNRAECKRLSRERLAQAPGWVQTIKCADIISNTSSIVIHDPEFAKTYLEEKRLLLAVLTKADARLLGLAAEQAHHVGDATKMVPVPRSGAPAFHRIAADLVQRAQQQRAPAESPAVVLTQAQQDAVDEQAWHRV